MLNKSKIALMGAIAAAGMVSTGANAATVNADARVNILDAVVVTRTAILDFGVIAAASTSGTVTIAPTTGATTCSAGLACAGVPQRGAFTVRGANGLTINVTVDPSTTLGGGPGAPMNLVLNPSATSVVGAGATLVPFHVGGVLTVGAAQTAGTYTGTYNVSADYQ